MSRRSHSHSSHSSRSRCMVAPGDGMAESPPVPNAHRQRRGPSRRSSTPPSPASRASCRSAPPKISPGRRRRSAWRSTRTPSSAPARERRPLRHPARPDDHARPPRHRQGAPGRQRQREDQDAHGHEVRPDALRHRGGGAGARVDDRQPQQHARRSRHEVQRLRPAAVPRAGRQPDRPRSSATSRSASASAAGRGQDDASTATTPTPPASALASDRRSEHPPGAPMRKTTSSPRSSPAARPSSSTTKGIRVVRGGVRPSDAQ